MTIDQRGYPRVDLGIYAFLNGKFLLMEDVSLAGLRCLTQEKIQEGATVEIKIAYDNKLPVSSENIAYATRVIWCKKLEDSNNYSIGMEFLSPDKQIRGDHLNTILNKGFAYVMNEVNNKIQQQNGQILELEVYKTLVEFSRDPIAVIQEGKGIFTNRSFNEIMGLTKEECRRKNFTEMIIEEDRPSWNEHCEMLIKEDKPPETFQITFLGREGEKIIFEAKTSKVNFWNQPAVLSIFRDISARINLKNKLIQAENLKILGEMATGIAHNFNNTLTPILSRVQLLKLQLSDPDKIKTGLSMIEKLVLDGANIIKRIQELAKVRRDEEGFAPVNLEEIISDAVEFLKNRWKEFEARGIHIKIRKQLIESAPVMGNPSELREVLVNILHNSFDAMSKGGLITIKTMLRDNVVEIKITDTGDGISVETQDKIFNPFFTTKISGSTGIGLSTCLNIINRHGGKIECQSVKEEGATFTVSIPVIKGVKKIVEKNEEKGVSPTSANKEADILVIDDEESNLDILHNILELKGHRAALAISGEVGIDLFKKRGFDLVFTDIVMPKMSGWEVAKKIKEINPHTPVVLITGLGVQLDNEKLKKAGVSAIIVKPFKLDQILELVDEFMELKDKM